MGDVGSAGAAQGQEEQRQIEVALAREQELIAQARIEEAEKAKAAEQEKAKVAEQEKAAAELEAKAKQETEQVTTQVKSGLEADQQTALAPGKAGPQGPGIQDPLSPEKQSDNVASNKPGAEPKVLAQGTDAQFEGNKVAVYSVESQINNPTTGKSENVVQVRARSLEEDTTKPLNDPARTGNRKVVDIPLATVKDQAAAAELMKLPNAKAELLQAADQKLNSPANIVNPSLQPDRLPPLEIKDASQGRAAAEAMRDAYRKQMEVKNDGQKSIDSIRRMATGYGDDQEKNLDQSAKKFASLDSDFKSGRLSAEQYNDQVKSTTTGMVSEFNRVAKAQHGMNNVGNKIADVGVEAIAGVSAGVAGVATFTAVAGSGTLASLGFGAPVAIGAGVVAGGGAGAATYVTVKNTLRGGLESGDRARQEEASKLGVQMSNGNGPVSRDNIFSLIGDVKVMDHSINKSIGLSDKAITGERLSQNGEALLNDAKTGFVIGSTGAIGRVGTAAYAANTSGQATNALLTSNQAFGQTMSGLSYGQRAGAATTGIAAQSGSMATMNTTGKATDLMLAGKLGTEQGNAELGATARTEAINGLGNVLFAPLNATRFGTSIPGNVSLNTAQSMGSSSVDNLASGRGAGLTQDQLISAVGAGITSAGPELMNSRRAADLTGTAVTQRGERAAEGLPSTLSQGERAQVGFGLSEALRVREMYPDNPARAVAQGRAQIHPDSPEAFKAYDANVQQFLGDNYGKIQGTSKPLDPQTDVGKPFTNPFNANDMRSTFERFAGTMTGNKLLFAKMPDYEGPHQIHESGKTVESVGKTTKSPDAVKTARLDSPESPTTVKIEQFLNSEPGRALIKQAFGVEAGDIAVAESGLRVQTTMPNSQKRFFVQFKDLENWQRDNGIRQSAANGVNRGTLDTIYTKEVVDHALDPKNNKSLIEISDLARRPGRGGLGDVLDSGAADQVAFKAANDAGGSLVGEILKRLNPASNGVNLPTAEVIRTSFFEFSTSRNTPGEIGSGLAFDSASPSGLRLNVAKMDDGKFMLLGDLEVKVTQQVEAALGPATARTITYPGDRGGYGLIKAGTELSEAEVSRMNWGIRFPAMFSDADSGAKTAENMRGLMRFWQTEPYTMQVQNRGADQRANLFGKVEFSEGAETPRMLRIDVGAGTGLGRSIVPEFLKLGVSAEGGLVVKFVNAPTPPVQGPALPPAPSSSPAPSSAPQP